jgi:hypothetical protein
MSSIYIQLTNANPISDRVGRSIDREGIFRVQFNATGSLLSGATNYGVLEGRLLDNSNNVIATKNWNLSGVPQDLSWTYSGDTYITYFDIRANVTGLTSGQATGVQVFDYGILLYDQNPVLVTTGIYWRGMVEPEFLSRQYLAPNYFIQLSASDSLNRLKDIPYPSSFIAGYVPQITTIRNAIAQTGIEGLPIAVQLNITSNNSTGSTGVLSTIKHNTYRFQKVANDGATTFWNCYQVLDRVLNLYNSKLFQSRGRWCIVADTEVASKRLEYDFDSLTASTLTTFSRVLDVQTSTLMINPDEMQKIRPVKQLTLKLLNYYFGENAISNGGFTSDLSDWNNGTSTEAFYNFVWDTGRLHTTVLPPSFGSDPNATHTFTSDPFNLTAVGTGNTVTVQIDANLDNVVWSATTSNETNPYIQVNLYKGASLIGTTFQTRMNDGLSTYQFTAPFTTTGSDYYLKVFQIPDTPSSQYFLINCYYDNAIISAHYSDTAVFDKLFLATTDGSTATRTLEKEIYFGDSSAGEIGQLQTAGGADTGNWGNYNSGSNFSLSQLLAYNTLRLNQRFKSFIRLQFFRHLKFEDVLQFRSKQFRIVGYSFDLAKNVTTLELVEQLTDPITMTFQGQTLTSVDGQVD